MDVVLPIDRFFRLFEEGEPITWASRRLDYSGRCHSPFILNLITRHDNVSAALKQQHYRDDFHDYIIHAANYLEAWGEETPLPPPEKPFFMPTPHQLHLSVRCRKCDACLNLRSWLWTMRAIRECAVAPRTWFCTYTASPSNRHLLSVRAGTDYADFKPICAEMMKDFTLYLKRLRKNSGTRFRYLLVAEKHKDGFPHLHALIHEIASAPPLTRRAIDGEWRLGFSTAKIAEDSRIGYVCKYLAKTQLARVRASLRYGETLPILKE